MNALCFQVCTLQPVLVTRLGAGEENSSQSFHYIPGSVLRGAAANLFLHQNPGIILNRDSLGERLFFGSCRFLNAYPTGPGGARTLPKPLSLRVEKHPRDLQKANGSLGREPQGSDGAKDDIYDFALQPQPDLAQPQLPPKEFISLDGAEAVLLNAKTFSQVHNTSQTRMIKGSGASQVYRYESLAAGQEFSAVILGEPELLGQLMEILKDQEVFLGGARSAGYGRSLLKNFRLEPDWYETPAVPIQGDQVVITLLSPAILRDKFGQPAGDLDAVLDRRCTVAFRSVEITGGFNRYWGLPLPQNTAVAAGSVFVYPLYSGDEALLNRLVAEGVGERREDGFGRLAVNWNRHPKQSIKQPEQRQQEQAGKQPEAVLSEESRRLARRMATRRLRAALDGRLVEALARLSVDSPPENSQLSQLRLAARQAQAAGGFKPILDYLDNVKQAREQFERARVVDTTVKEQEDRSPDEQRSTRLTVWLEDGLKEDSIWKKYLRPASLPTIGGEQAQEDSLRVEYVARLLDGLFKQTAREKGAKGGR